VPNCKPPLVLVSVRVIGRPANPLRRPVLRRMIAWRHRVLEGPLRDRSMNRAGPHRLKRITGLLLLPLARKALADERADLTCWDCDVIKGTPIPPGRMVCRITGRAASRGRAVRWSVFLRVPEPSMEHRDPIRREAFHRELMLYRSGVLDELPSGIAAPRLLGVTEHPGDEPWTWFEDVAAEDSIGWPLERFALAARHFGRLNGVFLGSATLAACPQLDRSEWFGKGVRRTFGQVSTVFEAFRTHPLTSRLWDADLGRQVRDLWGSREIFVQALDRMPRTLCHGDLCMPNLMSRRLDDGTDETVLIDWQYGGWSQIGPDIAGLIADSSLIPARRKVGEPEEFAEMMLDAYLSGLRDSGQGQSVPFARFGCLATLAYPWGLYVLMRLNDKVLQREPNAENRNQLEDALGQYVRAQHFVLRVAKQARKTLPDVLPGLCGTRGT